MIPSPLVSTHIPSERVRRLFAAMIKVLVESRFGYTMRDGEAFDLTHYPSLSEALDSIKKRLEIHKHFPDSMLRSSLAIQEAAILARAAPGTSDHALARILSAREATFATLKAKSDARQREQRVAGSIRRLTEEIKKWGRVHSRFLSAMEKLYSDRLFELKTLNLPDDVLAQATIELDGMFETAIDAER